MTKPSGPISILCAYDASGVVTPLSVNADGELLVDTGVPATVDASDVTYTPAVDADWDGSVPPGNQNLANDQLAERVKDLEVAVPVIDYPCRAWWHHLTPYIIAGNALAASIDGSQYFAYFAGQNVAANGDSFSYSAVLKAGAYTLKYIGITGTDRGIVDISFKHHLDVGYTTLVAGHDWYANPAAYNTVKTAAFTVVTGGRQIFKFTVNGKNASSSGYRLILSTFDIYLTAGDS